MIITATFRLAMLQGHILVFGICRLRVVIFHSLNNQLSWWRATSAFVAKQRECQCQQLTVILYVRIIILYKTIHEDVWENGGNAFRSLHFVNKWKWVVNFTPRSLYPHRNCHWCSFYMKEQNVPFSVLRPPPIEAVVNHFDDITIAGYELLYQFIYISHAWENHDQVVTCHDGMPRPQARLEETSSRYEG
jgi:hypothetical protein